MCCGCRRTASADRLDAMTQTANTTLTDVHDVVRPPPLAAFQRADRLAGEPGARSELLLADGGALTEAPKPLGELARTRRLAHRREGSSAQAAGGAPRRRTTAAWNA